jgi:hypothetical protein
VSVGETLLYENVPPLRELQSPLANRDH